LVLLWLLAVAAPRDAEVFATIREKGELPALTDFVLRIAPCLLWLLPFGFAVNARVLYVLGRLPRDDCWRVKVWFSLVLIGMIGLDAFVSYGLFQPWFRVTTLD
jgi:hypothetical protein